MHLKYSLGIFLLKIFAKLPLPLVQKIAHGLGRLAYVFPTRERKVTTANISHVFSHLSPLQQTQLIKNSLCEDSKSLVESASLWSKNATEINKLLSVHGEEHLQNTEDQGIIFAVPHMASWEIINLWLSIHHNISSLYRRPNSDTVENYIYQARCKFGATLVHDNIKGVLTLKRTLDAKKNICLAPDQDPGENGGIYALFFGQKANTSTLIPKLAQKSNAKIILTHTIRTKTGFKLYLTPASKEVYNKDLAFATLALNHDVEQIIQQKPEQYMWSGKRFRTQETQVDLYK